MCDSRSSDRKVMKKKNSKLAYNNPFSNYIINSSTLSLNSIFRRHFLIQYCDGKWPRSNVCVTWNCRNWAGEKIRLLSASLVLLLFTICKIRTSCVQLSIRDSAPRMPSANCVITKYCLSRATIELILAANKKKYTRSDWSLLNFNYEKKNDFFYSTLNFLCPLIGSLSLLRNAEKRQKENNNRQVNLNGRALVVVFEFWIQICRMLDLRGKIFCNTNLWI